MPPKKGKEAVPEPEPEPLGPLDLTPLSEQLRSPDEAVLAEALNKVLTLPFDDEATAAFEQAECLLPMLRLLQRPLPAVMGADAKPEEVFAHTLLAVRGLAKLSSYLYKAQRLMTSREPLEVLVMQLSHPWWPVVESALRALGALAHNQDAVELLCRTPQYTQLSALFKCITNPRPSVQLRALQVIQLLCRTYLCKWALCHVGLKAMEAVLRDKATAPDTLAACLTTLGLMVAGVKDAQAQLVERGLPETVMRLAVHQSAEVRLAMLKLLAELCNHSVLFALEVERIGGVNALHILVPKPERDPSTAPPDSTGDVASRATTPRAATPPPPNSSADKGAEQAVVDEWADVAPDGTFQGEVGATLIHEAFAADGVELPNAVAGGGPPTKSAKKKQRAAPPALKAARVTHLPMPKTCVEVEAALPLLFSTVGSLLQQPALRHSLLNKAEEFGYEPAWLSILCYHLEFYQPPPPEPEPEEEPELDPKLKAKAEAEAKKAAKNAPPPPEAEPEAAVTDELTESGKLKAQQRMQGGEHAGDITVTAMMALQQMLEDVSTVEALLAEPEERYLCEYDFLDNLQKHIEASNPRVVEAAVGIIQRLVQVGGEAAAAACEAAGIKATLRSVARQCVRQRSPLSSCVGECLLAWSLNDTVPPHRPPTPPIPSPPVSPRLPTWREQPLRARVTAAYAARHPPESDDDDSDDGGSPKKGRRKK